MFAQYYLTHGRPNEARELLPRSLKSLEKRKRASLLCPISANGSTTLIPYLRWICRHEQTSRRSPSLRNWSSSSATPSAAERSLRASWTRTRSASTCGSCTSTWRSSSATSSAFGRSLIASSRNACRAVSPAFFFSLCLGIGGMLIQPILGAICREGQVGLQEVVGVREGPRRRAGRRDRQGAGYGLCAESARWRRRRGGG